MNIEKKLKPFYIVATETTARLSARVKKFFLKYDLGTRYSDMDLAKQAAHQYAQENGMLFGEVLEVKATAKSYAHIAPEDSSWLVIHDVTHAAWSID
jgi:hypothetical protein